MHTDARDARPSNGTNGTNGSRFAEFIRSRVQDEHPAWTLSKEWAQLTALGALLATAADLLLLERKFGLLRGGFLAPDYLVTWQQRLFFFVTSVAADAGLLAPLVAAGLWLWGRHMRLSAAARGLITIIGALLPIVVANFVTLHLIDYLGDTINARILFELTGRSLAEVVAVAAGHLLRLGLVLAVAGAVVAVLGYFMQEDLYMAQTWGGTSNDMEYAYKLYGNYDGKGGRVGGKFVKTTSDKPELLTFAARDGKRTYLIVVNKSQSQRFAATVTLPAATGTVQTFTLSDKYRERLRAEDPAPVNGKTFVVNMAPFSATLVVVQ